MTLLLNSDFSENADLSMADLKCSVLSFKKTNCGLPRRRPWFWVGNADKYFFYAHLRNWQLLPCCKWLKSKNYTVQHNSSLLLSTLLGQIQDLKNCRNFKDYCSGIYLPVMIMSKEGDTTTSIIWFDTSYNMVPYLMNSTWNLLNMYTFRVYHKTNSKSFY